MKEINCGKQMKDVWSLPAIAKWEKSCGKHPTQKPLSVLIRIILSSTKKGAWILDPFTGSSTTGIAANLLERKFLGIDIEREYLEISKITDGESKSPGGGKALFFKNVKGSEFPVATNIFGSGKRIKMALSVKNLDEPAGRIREYIEFNPPKNLREAFNIIPMAVMAARFFPKKFRGKNPPCQEVILRSGNPGVWHWLIYIKHIF